MLIQFDFFAAWIRAHADTDRAASLVEYALLVSLIVVASIAAVTTLGKKLKSNFNSIASSI